MSLPGLTSYTGSSARDTFIQASGPGSRIDLSNVGTLTGGGRFEHVEINALSGGEIDLSGLTNIPGGATEVLAEGTDSVVDLTSLTSFVDSASDPSNLQVRDGGTLVTTNLSNIEAVSLIKNGSGTIETNQLTNIDSSSIFVSNGGTIALPSLTSYTGSSSFETFIQANGEGSQIDLSNVGTLTGGGRFEHVEINALSGGGNRPQRTHQYSRWCNGSVSRGNR